MLSSFVHVSSTELAEFMVTEQIKSCVSPTTPCRKPLGCKEILGAGATDNYNSN